MTGQRHALAPMAERMPAATETGTSSHRLTSVVRYRVNGPKENRMDILTIGQVAKAALKFH